VQRQMGLVSAGIVQSRATIFSMAGYTRAFSAGCAMSRSSKDNEFGKEAVKVR